MIILRSLCHFHAIFDYIFFRYRPSQNPCISIEFRAIWKICISKHVPKYIISRIGIKCIPCFRVSNQQNIVTELFSPQKNDKHEQNLYPISIHGGSLCIDRSCMMPVGNNCRAEVSNGEKKFSGPISVASNHICIS